MRRVPPVMALAIFALVAATMLACGPVAPPPDGEGAASPFLEAAGASPSQPVQVNTPVALQPDAPAESPTSTATPLPEGNPTHIIITLLPNVTEELEATPTPTPAFVPTPTAEPTAAGIPDPTPTATVAPSPTPTPTLSPAPTPLPTATPVPTATPAPTIVPTATATVTPPPTPTLAPTAMPTSIPTATPAVQGGSESSASLEIVAQVAELEPVLKWVAHWNTENNTWWLYDPTGTFPGVEALVPTEGEVTIGQLTRLEDGQYYLLAVTRDVKFRPWYLLAMGSGVNQLKWVDP